MKCRFIIIALAAALLTLQEMQAQPQDTNWVKNNTWYFDNFQKAILPWSLFRETYIGVAPEPSGDFDQLFYDYLYKNKLASSGHCFGMDVMAMLMKKNGGHLGYCYPPYVYPGEVGNSGDTVGPYDTTLFNAIGMVHGNQINHGFLLFLLDLVALNKSRDGNYAYQQVEYYLAKGDYPVISITKKFSPADGGHVLIPYFLKTEGTIKKIYVYDPNWSFYEPGPEGHGYYTSPTASNYITINSTSGRWEFNKNSTTPEIWSGVKSDLSSGNCIVLPLSVAGKKDRLPQSLFADIGQAINTIFIFGDVKVEQFEDENGRRYYNENGTGPETDDAKRLNYLMPFNPLGGKATKDPEDAAVYFFRRGNPVDIRYRAYGDYKIGMIFHGNYYELTGKGVGETDYFRVSEMKPAGKEKRAF
jgi:hypothetical protein